MAAHYPDIGMTEGSDKPCQSMNTNAKNVARGLTSAEVWLIGIAI